MSLINFGLLGMTVVVIIATVKMWRSAHMAFKRVSLSQDQIILACRQVEMPPRGTKYNFDAEVWISSVHGLNPAALQFVQINELGDSEAVKLAVARSDALIRRTALGVRATKSAVNADLFHRNNKRAVHA